MRNWIFLWLRRCGGRNPNLMLRDKRQRLLTKRQHLEGRESTIRRRGDVCGNKPSLKGGATFDTLLATPLVCCTIQLERSNYDRRSGDNEGVKLEQRRTSPPMKKGEITISAESSHFADVSHSFDAVLVHVQFVHLVYNLSPISRVKQCLMVCGSSFITRSCGSPTSLTHSIV